MMDDIAILTGGKSIVQRMRVPRSIGRLNQPCEQALAAPRPTAATG